MHKRHHALQFVVLLCLLCCPLAHASSLVGSSVTGSLTFPGDPSNYFDPGYGFVPFTGYLNAAGTTVAVSAGAVEFGYDDGASLLSADFSGNQFTISDLIELSGPTNGFELTFTDLAFDGQSFNFSSGNALPSSFSLVGNTLTLDYAGSNVTAGQEFTSTFSVAQTPEPSSLCLVVSSLMAGAGMLTRRRQQRSGTHA